MGRSVSEPCYGDVAPAPYATDAREVRSRSSTHADAQQGTINALYVESSWPRLERALAALKTGQGAQLMSQADEYYERNPDGTYASSQDAFEVIRCVDDVVTRYLIDNTPTPPGATCPAT